MGFKNKASIKLKPQAIYSTDSDSFDDSFNFKGHRIDASVAIGSTILDGSVLRRATKSRAQRPTKNLSVNPLTLLYKVAYSLYRSNNAAADNRGLRPLISRTASGIKVLIDNYYLTIRLVTGNVNKVNILVGYKVGSATIEVKLQNYRYKESDDLASYLLPLLESRVAVKKGPAISVINMYMAAPRTQAVMQRMAISLLLKQFYSQLTSRT